MSRLSKKDREWRRYQRKADREDKRSDKREDKFSGKNEQHNYPSDFQLPKTISEKKGL